jgi:hypothetical protein
MCLLGEFSCFQPSLGVSHEDLGSDFILEATTIKETRGSEWDKWELRVSGRVWIHRVKKRFKNDRYHDDQGEKGNPMG